MNNVFAETPHFQRQDATCLPLDEGYSRLQALLNEVPQSGRVAPGTGGLRKLRWDDERRGKGKQLPRALVDEYREALSQGGRHR